MPLWGGGEGGGGGGRGVFLVVAEQVTSRNIVGDQDITLFITFCCVSQKREWTANRKKRGFLRLELI